MQLLNYLETDSIANLADSNDQFAFNNCISYINSKTDEAGLKGFDLALIGIPDGRNNNNKGSALAPNKIRKELYCLVNQYDNLELIELGNIILGHTPEETNEHIKHVIKYLKGLNIVPIILGGSSQLLLPVFNAFKTNNKLINISSVISRFNFNEEQLNSYTEILLNQNQSVFNHSVIGYQSYYVSNKSLQQLNDLYFDHYRLGVVRSNIRDLEPVLRDTNIFELNINSIKQSDAPAYFKASPNGFYSEEICQIAKYAGLSDHLKAFCLFDLNPEFDFNDQTIKLAAQIIWYFIEGYYSRKIENPNSENENFTSFQVQNDESDLNLKFLKSNLTGRWWVQIPYNSNAISNDSLTLACSYEDYNKASSNEIPDRIWKFYQKIL